jgi:hypothetical protein
MKAEAMNAKPASLDDDEVNIDKAYRLESTYWQ